MQKAKSLLKNKLLLFSLVNDYIKKIKAKKRIYYLNLLGTVENEKPKKAVGLCRRPTAQWFGQ